MSDRPERRSWATPVPAVAALWVLAVLAASWCGWLVVAGADPAGRLVSGVAAAGLALAAASGTRARPRLEAGPDGVVVRRLTWTRYTPWARVERVRVLHTRRFGRRSALLELDLRDADGAERLVILGRPELGEEPDEVAEALAELRPRHPRTGAD